MKNKWFGAVQQKILRLNVLSVGLAILTLAAFLGVLFVFHHLHLLPYWLEISIYKIRIQFQTPATTTVLTGDGLFILCFLVYMLGLSKRWSQDFDQIRFGTQEMAGGNLQQHIPVFTNDELGELAANMNQVSVQLERALEEERLAVQAKNELITNVSHDLRTPLTSILGYLELIEKDRYKDEVELRYYTSIALEKSQRLERMVNDLFEYTRVNYGGTRLNTAKIDLAELLSQCSAQFYPLLMEEKMDIQTEFLSGNLMITADGDKLARVFENLIVNAIKYGKEGKTIDLKAYQDGDTAVVKVINYGTPIPQTDLPHLFDRFYRVEKSRSINTGGSGLGLAISKGIVELHKGSIKAYSSEKETVFQVTLPMKS